MDVNPYEAPAHAAENRPRVINERAVAIGCLGLIAAIVAWLAVLVLLSGQYF